jgi:hypothetical protein
MGHSSQGWICPNESRCCEPLTFRLHALVCGWRPKGALSQLPSIGSFRYPLMTPPAASIRQGKANMTENNCVSWIHRS